VTRRRRGDQDGTISLWVLGLSVMVLLLGGISLDLWRAFSERRALASTADAAAVAGAGALDEFEYRRTGTVQLLPALAERRAWDSLNRALERRALRSAQVAATTSRVTITVDGRVGFTLLGLVAPGEAVTVTVHAAATPRASG